MPKSNGSNGKRVANRLTQEERDQLQTLLFDPLYADLSVFQLYWHAFNQGRFMASLSTFYRIAKSIQASGDRRPLATHPKRTPPILLATGVNQVWCWDITRLPGHVCGHHYFLFALIDLYSRFVIGWMLATKENAELACHFLRENIRHTQRDFPIQHLVNH
ncbi:MAG: transposase family protein [Acidobacteria bacterium]|nr:transposase family protein [Acidobacteriota bacterium]MCB9399432.1 transposase family protein [Acidobacteriota bacterium]